MPVSDHGEDRVVESEDAARPSLGSAYVLWEAPFSVHLVIRAPDRRAGDHVFTPQRWNRLVTYFKANPGCLDLRGGGEDGLDDDDEGPPPLVQPWPEEEVEGGEATHRNTP